MTTTRNFKLVYLLSLAIVCLFATHGFAQKVGSGRAFAFTSLLSTNSKTSHGSLQPTIVEDSVGRKIPNFVLTDSSGKQVGLSDFSSSRYLVVVFMGTQCPIGNAYVPDLKKLQKDFADKSVQVIGINPVLSDSREDVAVYKKEYGIEFPILKDVEQLSVDLFGAKRTPEVFVLDRRRNVRYQGRIDDRIGYDFKREQANRADLRNAVGEMVDNKEVSVKFAKPLGCLITRKTSLKKKGEITYTRHVAKILDKRCIECHHKGTAAPFSLDSYDQARQWSEMVREVVSEQRMPPWDADPRHGKFSNDLSMTPQEIQTLVAWIDDGAPYGDKKELEKPKKFVEGWTIPKPDVVFKMPKKFKVKATGAVRYQYFLTPTNFKEDRWVQAAEARPGNRKVVHHIIGFVRPKGQGFHDGLPAVAGYAPGEEPMIYPKGMGFKVPAGADIVWQVHYTPIGKEETDQSEIGLVFCKEKPERPVYQSLAINTRFEIPPGAEKSQVKATRKLNQAVELISLMPHMHVRGKDFRYTAILPSGERKILLDIPDYDFNWQHRYRFKEPVYLEAGTVIECVAHYDNSKENPANPDPKKRVRWGDQTWEEMMIGYFNYVKPVSKD